MASQARRLSLWSLAALACTLPLTAMAQSWPTKPIKLLVGFGESLAGHLMAIDYRTMHCRKVAVARDLSCPVCGGK